MVSIGHGGPQLDTSIVRTVISRGVVIKAATRSLDERS